MMKLEQFDFDNIETDDYHHPLDPDDSTHSRLLTVYFSTKKTNDDIKKEVSDTLEKAENADLFRIMFLDSQEENKLLKEELGKTLAEKHCLNDYIIPIEFERDVFKKIVEKIKKCKIEYEDYIKLRNEDPDYRGWCNESIRLDFIKELLATKEGNSPQ